MKVLGSIPDLWEGQIGQVSPKSVNGSVATYVCPTEECDVEKERDLNSPTFGRWSPWCGRPHYHKDYFRVKRSRSHHLVNSKVVKRSDSVEIIHN